MFEKNNIMNLQLKIYNKQYMLGKGLNKKKSHKKWEKFKKGVSGSAPKMKKSKFHNFDILR